jgi:AAA domain (dynein-related subfamily)
VSPTLRRLHACILAGVPALLWGPPGGGKTETVKSYARMTERHLERWLLSRCESIDLKPRIIVDGQVIVCDPPEIARATKAGAAGPGAIVFYDELNRAPTEVIGAALDRIDSSPAGVAVVAACNPPTRGQAARSLESAAANRFCHLDMGLDADAYAAAQVTGWASDASVLVTPHAADIAKGTSLVRSLASAFIRHRGVDVLSKEPADPVLAGRAWPSPRTWDHAIRVYAVARALSYDPEDCLALVGGCIGTGLGVEFLAFVADSEIDPEALLANPKAWTPPAARVDKTIGALTMVVAAVAKTTTDDRWKAAWALVGVACDAGQADAGMVAANMLLGLPKGTKLAPAHTLMPPKLAKLLAGRARK